MRNRPLIIILGAGDLASGVAHRLFKCQFNVIMTELPEPLVVRRTVSFAEAIYSDEIIIEDVRGKKCMVDGALKSIQHEPAYIPVVIDPEREIVSKTTCDVLVDAKMAKANAGTMLDDAPLVIGLGPGFNAGIDVHKVIETQRGHTLGRVIDLGTALSDTGIPEPILGIDSKRIFRAPTDGQFRSDREIGTLIKKGDILATVDGVEVRAEIDGLLRGLLHTGLRVIKGTKLGDIDPRGNVVDFRLISDKSRAIAGGVLEAILSRNQFSVNSRLGRYDGT